MSTIQPMTERSTLKLERVLACVLCQQRKVKCDRKFPCANCLKSRAECIPATLTPRRRKRRFPERELLERLRKYEDLLRQNNIKFEPLHKDTVSEKESPNAEGGYDSDSQRPGSVAIDWPSPSSTVKSERVYEAKSIWDAMSQGFRDPDNDSDSSHEDLREVVLKNAWDQHFENGDHLLFGSRKTNVNLSTLHPEPVDIFRLWQIYLDNVNPLLKVTHTPSLQVRIIEAASNLSNIRPTLEALMFSIYCMSIQSLDLDDSQTMFGLSKKDLLTKYRFGCQQALSNCGFLRTGDRDCLTALYLYLFSVRSSIAPQSLSSMLAIAIRIAQRMGIHSEAALAKCTALEAEMRRRLWWSLILFDTRICEMSDYKATMLAPSWDCRIPLNVNDSDLRLEMKDLPVVQGTSTEALFIVVRSEVAEFIRNSMFYLEFTNPALKPIAKDIHHGPIPEGGEAVALEKMIEDKYLKFCDPENMLHFMTIWMTRSYLAKCRLVEHYSVYYNSSVHQTEAQCDAGISYALRMLECDTKLMASPLTKRFFWLNQLYFPMPAYIQIVQDLRRRPVSKLAEQSWEVMSTNYEARFDALYGDGSPFFRVFAKLILQAWEGREAVLRQSDEPFMLPTVVSRIREQATQMGEKTQHSDTEQPDSIMSMGVDNFWLSMPMNFDSHPILSRLGGPDGYVGTEMGVYPNMPGQAPLEVDVNGLDWSAMDWSLMNAPSGYTAGSTDPSRPY